MIVALALSLAAIQGTTTQGSPTQGSPPQSSPTQSPAAQGAPTQSSLGGFSVTPFTPSMQWNLVAARMLDVRLSLPGQDWQEQFILAIPTTVTWPAPVLTLFHGYGEEPADVVQNSPLVNEAMARGYVVFIPLGAHKYNYGIEYAQRNIELAFEFLVARLPLDLDRIHAAGFSMGGGAAASFAARHMDPDGLRIASVVNHTGTASLRATYHGSNDTGLFESPLMFGTSPALDPFAYQRSSTVDLDAISGTLIDGGSMAPNLSHVPIRHWNADLDPNPFIVEQTERLHDELEDAGADSTRHVVPSIEHAWHTIDAVAVMDWVDGQSARSPIPGEVVHTVADRDGRWNQLHLEQDQSGAFSPLKWSSQPASNALWLIEMANMDRVGAHVDDLGLDRSAALRVILQVTDASTPEVVLSGFPQAPIDVLRRGVSTSAWTHDSQAGTLTLHETASGWSDWTIVP